MKTIFEPAKPYFKLLGHQKSQAGATYRLMNFVVQAEVDDGLLLLHNMTKEMVLLSQEERQALEQSPTDLPELISHWFLVPEAHDDCKLSQQLTHVARLMAVPPKSITGYTVMTTSDCNARCFYCYELGQARRPMTEETALQTADYIISHCGGEAVCIEWFGGEPLYNKSVIQLICRQLKEAGVNYTSTMISNGYLLDEDTIREARDLWNLKEVQITIDGTEQTYNRVKAYIYQRVNAYEQVMANIGHLLAADISVSIRMNIDMHNADDLERLAAELHERFEGQPRLSAYVHLLFEDKAKRSGVSHDDKRRQLLERQRQIEEKLAGWGLFKSRHFSPSIKTGHCMADNDGSVVIQPDGYITKCEHHTDSHHVGHINSGEQDAKMLAWFKEKGTMLGAFCRQCVKYPDCMFLLSCPNYEECYPEMPRIYAHKLSEEMKTMYKAYLEKGSET